MANESNLIPNSQRTPEELREQTRKGGINSGKSRRKKADIHEAVTNVLNGVYPTKQGDKLSGIDMLAINLFKMATDSKNKQCLQANKLLLELYGQGKSPEDLEKIKAEIKLLNAKANIMSGGNKDIEDLTALAELLK